MSTFYPIFHPIFKFPSKNDDDHPSIKFIKSKEQGGKTQEFGEQLARELELRLAKDTSDKRGNRVVRWLFHGPK